MLNIAVLIKQVPDSDDVKMNAETGTMIREGVSAIINPLDLNALYAAVNYKKTDHASVTALSMGPPQAEGALREAIAIGADRAVLASSRHFAGADTWATALTLAAAIKKLGGFDLILAGEKATDGETGQVGPEVAAILGVPFATYVSALDIQEGCVTVTRTIEEGLQRQRLAMPCLVTALNNLNEPSIPTLSGKKKARRAHVERLSEEDLNLSKKDIGLEGSPTRVVKIHTPTISRDTKFFASSDIDDGIEEVIKLLKDIAVI